MCAVYFFSGKAVASWRFALFDYCFLPPPLLCKVFLSRVPLWNYVAYPSEMTSRSRKRWPRPPLYDTRQQIIFDCWHFSFLSNKVLHFEGVPSVGGVLRNGGDLQGMAALNYLFPASSFYFLH